MQNEFIAHGEDDAGSNSSDDASNQMFMPNLSNRNKTKVKVPFVEEEPLKVIQEEEPMLGKGQTKW